ncbi:MAG: hypothetical protein ACI9TY_000786 [Alphaproteobacteria bacterium]|jgi:hypothetical protein
MFLDFSAIVKNAPKPIKEDFMDEDLTEESVVMYFCENFMPIVFNVRLGRYFRGMYAKMIADIFNNKHLSSVKAGLPDRDLGVVRQMRVLVTKPVRDFLKNVDAYLKCT